MVHWPAAVTPPSTTAADDADADEPPGWPALVEGQDVPAEDPTAAEDARELELLGWTPEVPAWDEPGALLGKDPPALVLLETGVPDEELPEPAGGLPVQDIKQQRLNTVTRRAYGKGSSIRPTDSGRPA